MPGIKTKGELVITLVKSVVSSSVHICCDSVTHKQTLIDKSMCQLSGLFSSHDEGKRSESLLLFQLPTSVCLSLLPSSLYPLQLYIQLH